MTAPSKQLPPILVPPPAAVSEKWWPSMIRGDVFSGHAGFRKQELADLLAIVEVLTGDDLHAVARVVFPERVAHADAMMAEVIQRAETAETRLEQAHRDMKAERDGNMSLRQRHGALPHEIFPDFVARLSTERDDARELSEKFRRRAEKAEAHNVDWVDWVEPWLRRFDCYGFDGIWCDEEARDALSKALERRAPVDREALTHRALEEARRADAAEIRAAKAEAELAALREELGTAQIEMAEYKEWDPVWKRDRDAAALRAESLIATIAEATKILWGAEGSGLVTRAAHTVKCASDISRERDVARDERDAAMKETP